MDLSKMSEAETQSVWGWLVATDFFFGGTGAGLFLVSLVLGIYGLYADLPEIGLVTGLIFVAIGLLFLAIHEWERRTKLLNILRRPGTSWISRGTIFNIVFVLFGVLYSAPHWLSWVPWAQHSEVGYIVGAVAGVAALMVILYPGMFLSSLNSIPFWNSPFIPLLFIAYGLTGALGTLSLALRLLMVISPVTTSDSLLLWQTVLLVATLALVVAQLVWASLAKPESKRSADELVRGKLLYPFVVGSLLVGLLIPLTATAYAYFTGNFLVSATAGALILVGSVLHKYTVLRAGIYVQLIPDSWPASSAT